MVLIDAHAHLPADHPRAAALLAELGVRVLNISLGLDAEGRWRSDPMSGVEPYRRLSAERPRRFAWCTAFDPPTPADFGRSAAYVERTLSALAREFAEGAVACKVWKNVGMDVRDGEGNFVGVDHPLFTPVFEFIQREDRALILHTGEPRACWLPLDPQNPHYEYYREHPQWHMHGRAGVPTCEELIAARDRVLARHPKLRVVGAHLGSLEYDVAEVAARFWRFPNFWVDTAERLLDLALQPVTRVQAFFEAYADRVLYGSDLLFERAFSSMGPEELEQSLARVRRVLLEEQAFYRSSATVIVKGRPLPGLALPPGVQQQLFETNARRCYRLSA